jgi:hypothetical protein
MQLHMYILVPRRCLESNRLFLHVVFYTHSLISSFKCFVMSEHRLFYPAARKALNDCSAGLHTISREH